MRLIRAGIAVVFAALVRDPWALGLIAVLILADAYESAQDARTDDNEDSPSDSLTPAIGFQMTPPTEED